MQIVTRHLRLATIASNKDPVFSSRLFLRNIYQWKSFWTQILFCCSFRLFLVINSYVFERICGAEAKRRPVHLKIKSFFNNKQCNWPNLQFSHSSTVGAVTEDRDKTT